MSVADLRAFHREQAQIAHDLYVAGFSPNDSALHWTQVSKESTRRVMETLEQSCDLMAVATALEGSGRHIAVLRRMLAPPMSQDQFALLCPEYSKQKEKSGRPLDRASAEEIAEAFDQWRDKSLTPWVDAKRKPTNEEKAAALAAVSMSLSEQVIGTGRRTLRAFQQEAAVVELLENMGWKRVHAALVTQSAQLSSRQFAHKTRFATKSRPQEVDIACGLGKSFVLAMECKVTNDKTNSVKRINDVLKKAHAWQDHWGSFVKTAALLQGVVAFKDVERLLDANVEVFWSHRLQDFEAWVKRSVVA
jgi:hypothetical protein